MVFGVFGKVNFTVTFLLIKKTWDGWFAGKVGGWEILRNGGGGRGGGEGRGGGWYPFTDYGINTALGSKFGNLSKSPIVLFLLSNNIL